MVMCAEDAFEMAMFMELFSQSEEMQKDFANFNIAVDELIAQGMTEEEALMKVSENWDFKSVAEDVEKKLEEA